jgi:hypothetical protein
VGSKVGEECRADVLDLYHKTVEYLAKNTSLSREQSMVDVAVRHLRTADELWIPSVDFLRGLARGAAVSLEKVALTSFAEEISCEKCSTLVMRTQDRRYLLVHNEDYTEFYRGKMVLLDVTFDGFPRLVCLTYPGMLPSLAGSLTAKRNKFFRIATLNNSFWFDAQPGLPKQVLHFRASLASDIYEAKDWLTKTPVSLPTHYTVACGRTGQVFSVTVLNQNTSDVGAVILPIGSQSFCHTNHLPNKSWKLKKDDPAGGSSHSSVIRYNRLQDLKAHELPQTHEEAFKLFSEPPLFRNEAGSATLATVVICPETGDFWLRDADPSAEKKDWHFNL